MPRVSLTARNVNALKAPERGQRDYFDKTLPGFSLRVPAPYADGNGKPRDGRRVYYVLYRSPATGKKRRFKIGPADVYPLADARERAKAALKKVHDGIDPADERQEQQQAEAFGDLADDYIERYAKRHKRSWRNDRQIIEHNLKPALGTTKANRVTRAQVIRLLDDMAARGAPIAANRTLEVLRRIYNWAIDKELLENNPAAGIKKPAPENERKRALKLDELRDYWLALCEPRQHLGDRIAAGVLRVMVLTNQRRNEVTRMRWQDLDLATGWWEVPAELTKTGAKTGQTYRLPITPKVREIIDEMRTLRLDDTWVFPQVRGGAPVAETTVKTLFNEVVRERLGIGDYRPHDTLHTVTTFMSSDEVGLGLSDDEIARIRHHVPGNRMTGRYNHHRYDAEKRRNLTAWENWLLVLAGERKPAGKVVALQGEAG